MDTPGAGTDQSSQSTNDAVQDLVIRAAATQVASMSALVRFWIEWAEAAETYTKGLGAELTRIQKNKSATDSVGRVSDMTREYVRQMTDLPATTARAFLTEVERFNANQPERAKPAQRVRSARAKP